MGRGNVAAAEAAQITIPMTTFGLRTRVRLMAGSGREPIVAIVADIAFKKSRRFIVFLVFLSCRFAMKGE
ncbi:MAG: hypothetical protein ACYTDW_21355 [Planctomycetota bacterium]